MEEKQHIHMSSGCTMLLTWISGVNEIFSWSKTKHADEINFTYAQVNCDFYKNGRWIDSSSTAPPCWTL